MKKIKLLSLFMLVTVFAFAQDAPKSPAMKAEGKVQGVAVEINYSAPSVRGRQIWGGLEKYGKVWRAGANQNTTVAFDQDVKINGKALKAGKYGFFMIPNESGDWVVIFNTKNDAWGAGAYKESEDALRINLKPTFANDVQEQLKYDVTSKGINFAWDKARISVEVSK